MKQFILKHKKAIISAIGILLIGGITMSFQDSPFGQFAVQEDYECSSNCIDTVPDKDAMKMKDFEKLQLELDRSLLQVNDEMKKMDLSKIQKEIAASLKDVDMDKIRKDVELALQSVDMDKILADVGASIKDLKTDYKSEEIEKALAEARAEVEKAKLEINKIDKDVIKKELDNAKKEIEKSKREISKIDIDKIMAEARSGINKAREELNITKEMFTEMEKDGLINPKNGFTVEYKNKELFIDGKKQSAVTTDKYRKYFKQDHFKMTIEKE